MLSLVLNHHHCQSQWRHTSRSCTATCGSPHWTPSSHTARLSSSSGPLCGALAGAHSSPQRREDSSLLSGAACLRSCARCPGRTSPFRWLSRTVFSPRLPLAPACATPTAARTALLGRAGKLTQSSLCRQLVLRLDAAKHMAQLVSCRSPGSRCLAVWFTKVCCRPCPALRDAAITGS